MTRKGPTPNAPFLRRDSAEFGQGSLGILWALELGHGHFQPRKAVSGLVALAVSCSAAKPTSYAMRPASTASLKASAMRFGSSATAIAVFTSTASAPISIASAAWLGAPSPASPTAGPEACAMLHRML